MTRICATAAAALLLAAPAFAQMYNENTATSRYGVAPQRGQIETGRSAKSPGGAVRDQSYIGSGGRRGESGWVGGAPRRPPTYYGGADPKQAGQVGDTGTGQ